MDIIGENIFEIYDLLAFEIHEAYESGKEEILRSKWQPKKGGKIWEKWVDSSDRYKKYTTDLGDTIEFIGHESSHYFKINGKLIWVNNTYIFYK